MRYHASVKGTPGGYPLGFIVHVAEADPVSPPTPPAEARKRFTESEKNALRQLSRFVKTQAKVNAVIAIVLAFDPDPSVSKIGAAASGGGAVVYESIGDIADDLYNDPPDPNFKTVAAPAVLRVPHMHGTDVKSTANATAINRYYDAVAHRASLYRALLTAIERAQGAAIARRPVYERRQMLAAAALASSLANDSNKFIATSGAAVQAFVRAGVTLNVTKAVADRAQQVVGKSGPPPAFSAALAQFSPDDAAALRRQLVGSLETARGRFPQTIADPNALKTYRAEAAALRAFVRHVNANPTAAAP